MRMARICDNCGVTLGEGETQDAKRQAYGDYCDACVDLEG